MNFLNFLPKHLLRFFSIEPTQGDNTELVIFPKEKDDEQSTSGMTMLGNFAYIDNVLKFFEFEHVKMHMLNGDIILVLKLEVANDSSGLSKAEIEEIVAKCGKRSIVLLLALADRSKFFLYWKSKNIQHLLKIYVYDFMHDLIFFEFITSFLSNCLKRDHLGLPRAANIEATLHEISFHFLMDERNFNLLLLAAEQGNLHIVDILIRTNIETEFGEINPQTLAWDGEHFDVLNLLLQANFTLPKSLDLSKCPENIKRIVDAGKEMHEAIANNDVAKVEDIRNQNSHLRHFYSLTNESATTFALKTKRFQIYSKLLSSDVMHGARENVGSIKKRLSKKDMKELTEVQYNNTDTLLDSHMHFLLSNSKTFGLNTANSEEKYKFIRDIFEVLNAHPFIQIILRIVAASRRISIIFDLNSDSVEFIDPESNGDTRGIFYTTGRIYIGARGLLDGRRFEVLGTLAHELCHHAMSTVYDNFGLPYCSLDSKGRLQFQSIVEECEAYKETEKIIDYAYLYSTSMLHAELIVRVPHLIALYIENPEKLNSVRETFSSLFEFYEHKNMKEMEKAIPRIEKKAETHGKRSAKFIIFISLFLLIFGISGGIFIAKSIFRNSDIRKRESFEDLTGIEQESIKNAPIWYKNVKITFNALFKNDSVIYSRLNVSEIHKMLDGIILNFSDPSISYLDMEVRHSFRNLTMKLRDKFLNSNFTFQNEGLQFHELYKLASRAFNSLNTEQIRYVLDGNNLKVHKFPKNDFEFYINREFHDEGVVINAYTSYMTKTLEKKFTSCMSMNSTKTLKPVNETSKLSIIQNLKLWNLSKQKQVEFFVDDKCKKLNRHHWDLADFILAGLSKFPSVDGVFVISGEEGAGKTVALKHMAMIMKKLYPSKWIHYMDLMENVENFEYLAYHKRAFDIERILNVGLENKFEKEIFWQLLRTGNVIIFWDGIDKVSPRLCAKIIENLKTFPKLRNIPKIIQFIATRPLVEKSFKIKYNHFTFRLIPFDNSRIEEYLEKVLTIPKEEVTQISKKVIKFVESSTLTSTPILLIMIGELIENNVNVYGSENLYEIYHKFFELSSKTLYRNCGIFDEQTHRIITKLYQRCAISNEFGSIYSFRYFSDLEIMKINETLHLKCSLKLDCKNMPRITSNQVAKIDFHKTYTQFFIASYLIENILYADDLDSDDEADLRIYFLLNIATSLDYQGENILRFISAFLESSFRDSSLRFHPKIREIFLKKYRRFLFFWMSDDREFYKFEFILNFIKHDHELLKEMLHVDENETLYTSTFNFYYPKRLDDIENIEMDRLKIEEITKVYLSPEEHRRFLNGRHQKGVYLLSLYYYSQYVPYDYMHAVTHESIKIDVFIYKQKSEIEVFEEICKSLTKNEIDQLLINGKSPIFKRGRDKFSVLVCKSFWNFVGKTLTNNEFKKFIFLMAEEKFAVDQIIKEFLVVLTKLFTDSEIFELFMKTGYASNFIDHISPFWKFIENHTSVEQQKEILAKRDVHIPNILEAMLVSKIDWRKVKTLKEIYEKHFNIFEIQQMVSSWDGFLLELFDFHINGCNYRYKYITTIFAENDDLFLEFLEQKVESTGENIFDYLYNDETQQLNLCSKIFYEKYIEMTSRY